MKTIWQLQWFWQLGKKCQCCLSKEIKTMHVLQTVQEHFSVYFAVDQHFMHNMNSFTWVELLPQLKTLTHTMW